MSFASVVEKVGSNLLALFSTSGAASLTRRGHLYKLRCLFSRKDFPSLNIKTQQIQLQYLSPHWFSPSIYRQIFFHSLQSFVPGCSTQENESGTLKRCSDTLCPVQPHATMCLISAHCNVSTQATGNIESYTMLPQIAHPSFFARHRNNCLLNIPATLDRCTWEVFTWRSSLVASKDV